MKISILTADFSNNCFGRSWLLAKLLEDDFKVEIVGPAYGDGVWGPLKDICDFEMKIVRGFPDGHFEFKKMYRMISGDVIYANKPLVPSFGVGLLKKTLSGIPLVLDIDDWEMGFGKTFYDSLSWYKKINDFRLSFMNFRSYYYSILLENLIYFADAITISNRRLQARYGGTVIWHTREVAAPVLSSAEKNQLKRKYLSGKSVDAFLVGFIGTPRPHKGLEVLIDAAQQLANENISILLVGFSENDYCDFLREKIVSSGMGKYFILINQTSFEKLSEILSIIDLVVTPQSYDSISDFQIPAKLFDAMAMGKPIVASNTQTISDVLDGCGYLVPPDDSDALAEKIRYIASCPEREPLGQKAKRTFDRRYNWSLMKRELDRIFNSHKLKIGSTMRVGC